MNKKKILISLLIYIFVVVITFFIIFKNALNRSDEKEIQRKIDFLILNQDSYYQNFYKRLFINLNQSKFELINSYNVDLNVDTVNLNEFESEITFIEKFFHQNNRDHDAMKNEFLKIKNKISDTLNKIKIFFSFYEELIQNKNKISTDYFKHFKKNFFKIAIDNIGHEFQKKFDKNFKKIKNLKNNINLILLTSDGVIKPKIDIKKFNSTLEQEIYGQKKLKNNFIELVNNGIFFNNAIKTKKFLSLIGCPDSGKTYFVQTIAKALEYKFVKIPVKIFFNPLEIETKIFEIINNFQKNKIILFLDLNQVNPNEFLVFFERITKIFNCNFFCFEFNNVIFILDFPNQESFDKYYEFNTYKRSHRNSITFRKLTIQNYLNLHVIKIFDLMILKEKDKVQKQIIKQLNQNNIYLTEKELFQNFNIFLSSKYFLNNFLKNFNGFTITNKESQLVDVVNNCQCRFNLTKLEIIALKIVKDKMDEMLLPIDMTNPNLTLLLNTFNSSVYVEREQYNKYLEKEGENYFNQLKQNGCK